jgi:hypothetical protein
MKGRVGKKKERYLQIAVSEDNIHGSNGKNSIGSRIGSCYILFRPKLGSSLTVGY